MADLMIFDVSAVSRAMEELRDRLVHRLRVTRDLVDCLDGFHVRDKTGAYWAPGPLSGRWYRHDGSEWRQGPAPAGPLEGPVWIDELATPVFRATEFSDYDEPPIEVPPDAGFLAETIASIRSGYLAGAYSATDAVGLLQQSYVIDDRGALWTVGFRTGEWYRMNDGNWERQAGPPAPTTLPREDLMETLVPAILMSLADILTDEDRLPEPVSEPWAPPGTVPEAVGLCTACRTPAACGERYCASCGSTIAPLEHFVAEEPNEPVACPACGAQTKPGRPFCTQCGARLNQSAASGTITNQECTCATCGASVTPGDRSCTACGAEIEQGY